GLSELTIRQKAATVNSFWLERIFRCLKLRDLLQTNEHARKLKRNGKKRRNSAGWNRANARRTRRRAPAMKIRNWQECSRALSPNATGWKHLTRRGSSRHPSS